MAAEHKEEWKQDALGYIEIWQEKTDPRGVADVSGPIARLYNACTTLYRDILVRIRTKDYISEINVRLLERSFSTLSFWGLDFDVSRGNLDRTLKHSHSLSRSTLKLLASIGKVLAMRLVPFISIPPEEAEGIIQKSQMMAIMDEVLYIRFESDSRAKHIGHEDGEDSSEPEDDNLSDYGPDSLEEIAADLSTNVQSLVDMQDAYEHPATDLVDQKEARLRTVAERPPSEYYSDLISIKFPDADESLVRDLGEENWKRFLRCRDDREKHNQLEIVSEDHPVPAEQTVVGTKFHDSALGTSVNISTAAKPINQYAETVMSFHRGDGSSVRFPRLPEAAKRGEPLECAACGRTVFISTNASWKAHLCMDLRPYSCYYDTCSRRHEPFELRNDWIEHIGLDHGLAPEWKSALCPLCLEQTGDGRAQYSRHIASHLEEIALAVIPNDLESESECESEIGLSTASAEYSKDSHHSPAVRLDKETEIASGLDQATPSALGDAGEQVETVSTSVANTKRHQSGRLNLYTPKTDKLEPEEAPNPTGKGRRTSTSSVHANRDYIVDLVDPSSARKQPDRKHPANFQCSLCPKRFTRAYNLRSHLRTHTDERPFVCAVCGKAFARQHDRRRHEGLHSDEKKFVCRGNLKDGNIWGCGQRFARADALSRHFHSEDGYICIKPLLEEDIMERMAQNSAANNLAGMVQTMTPQPLSGQPTMQSFDNSGLPDYKKPYMLPGKLLAQYPTLGGIRADLPANVPEDDISGRSTFDASAAGEYDDDQDFG